MTEEELKLLEDESKRNYVDPETLENFDINNYDKLDIYEELNKLVINKRNIDKKTLDYLKTYCHHYMGKNPDVAHWEMEESNSKSKYVHTLCMRCTYSLKLEKKTKKKFALKNFCNNISII